MSDGNQLWTQLLGRLTSIIPDPTAATYALSAIVAKRNGASLSWGASWSGGLPLADVLHNALSDMRTLGRPAVCLGSADLTSSIRQAFDGISVNGFIFAAVLPDGSTHIAGDGKHCSSDEWKRIMGAIDLIKGDLSHWLIKEQKTLAEKDVHDIYDLAEKVFSLDKEDLTPMDMVARCSRRLYKDTTHGLGIAPFGNHGVDDPTVPGIQINGIVEGTDIEAARSMKFPFSSAHFRAACDALSAELDDSKAEWDAEESPGCAAPGMRP